MGTDIRLNRLLVLLIILVGMALVPSWGRAQTVDVLVFSGHGGHETSTAIIMKNLAAAGITSERVYTPELRFPRSISGQQGNKAYFYMFQNYPKFLTTQWDAHMRNGEREDASLSSFSNSYYVNAEHLLRMLNEKKPKVVLFAWGYAAEPFQYLKETGAVRNLPRGVIHTDYGRQRFWTKLIPNSVEMTFGPDQGFVDTAIANGADPSRVTVSGIPSNPNALAELSEEQIAELRNKIGFEAHVPTILIGAGSSGVGAHPQIIDSLRKQFKGRKLQIIAATGGSQALYDSCVKIKEDLKGDQNIKIHVMGFDKSLPLYMKFVADVVVSKPGGLTTTEVALMNRPFILLVPAMAQEEDNVQLFVKKGMALSSRPEAVGETAMRLIDDASLREKMSLAQKQLRDTYDISKITKWVEDQIERQEKTGEKPQFEKAPPPGILSTIRMSARACYGLVRYGLANSLPRF